MLHAALALALALPTQAPGLFALGDIVNVRRAPAANAEVIARVRINTELAQVDDAGAPAWVHVTLAHAGRADVVGFVARELVADAPLDLGSAQGAAAEASARGDANAAALWKKRARVLDLDAPAPLFLAMCNGSRAVLLAVDEGAGLRALAGESVTGLEAAARSVISAQWHAQTESLPGTPFPTPFGAPQWNDATGALPAVPGEKLDHMDNETAPLPLDRAGKLVLGPCAPSQRGLLATAPFSIRQTAGVAFHVVEHRGRALIERWRREDTSGVPTAAQIDPFPYAQDGSATVRRIEVMRVLDGNLIFTSATVHATWMGHHGDYDGERAKFTLDDDDGRALVPPTHWAGEGALSIQWQRGGHLLVLPKVAQDEGDGAGFVLIAPLGAGLDVLEVVTDRAGC